MEPVERRSRARLGGAGGGGNVVFVPVRVAVTTVGAGLGGLTGRLTAGNEHAADDIWGLPPFDGQTYLQPEMMYGDEPLMIGDLEYRMHVTSRARADGTMRRFRAGAACHRPLSAMGRA